MSLPTDTTLRLAMAAVVLLSVFTLIFVAYAFYLHLKGQRLERRRSRLEAAWKKRLLDAATGEATPAPDPDRPNAEEREVPPEDRVLFLELVTDYARALHGPERRNLEQVAAPYLDALDPLLDDAHPYRRAHGLDILSELSLEEARERIVRGLSDESGLVAMVAARALARNGDPEHVPLLLARLEAFENWSANYLASLLSSFGSAAVPYLRALAMDTSATGRFRCVALQALRELNDLESVESAVRLLPDENDAEVQSDLIRLIGRLGRPEHLDVIREHASSPVPHVRAASLRAVSELSDRRTSDVELVSRGLDDPSPWVALQSAHGLMKLGRAHELSALATSESPRADLAAEVLEAHR
ncbi:MAG: HEAT repeat domain-containing protein [Gemmatimonadota bacterium]|nr:HEAT repeat domain-containing protein [Gemmatimonadota bacterium]